MSYRIWPYIKLNSRTYTQSHIPTVIQVRWGLMEPSLEFWICCSNSNRFYLYLQRKAFDLFTRWGLLYGWWRPVTSTNMVAILAAILDFTNNHFTPYIQLKESGILPTIGIRNPNSTDKKPRTHDLKSEIHSLKSRIQDCLGFPYTGTTYYKTCREAE